MTSELSQHAGLAEVTDEAAAEVQEGLWSRIVSVQACMALLCLVSIVSCSLVTSLTFDSVYSEALDDTRETCDSSLALLSSSSLLALKTSSAVLMDYNAVSFVNTMRNFVERGFDTSFTVKGFSLTTFARANKSDEAMWKSIAAPHLYVIVNGLHQMLKDGQQSPVSAVSLTGGGFTYGLILPNNLNAQFITAFVSRPGELVPTFGPVFTPDGLSPPALSRPFGPQAADHVSYLQRIIKPGETKMTSLDVIGGYLVFPIAGTMPDLHNPGALMSSLAYMTLSPFDNILHNMASNTQNGARLRAFTLLRSSWMVDALRAEGYATPEKFEQAGILTGVTHGNATKSRWGFDDFVGKNTTLYTPRKAVEAEDGVIRGLAVHLEEHGYEHAKEEGIHPVVVDVDGENETHYVGVYNITDHTKGLDWWLVVSMDERSLLKEVLKTRTDVTATIEVEQDKVKDDIDEKVTVAIIVVVALALALLVVSLHTTTVVLKPIKKIQHALHRVARMELDGHGVSRLSRLYEARTMQRDFLSMVDSLREFRAYVPSAILGSSSSSSLTTVIAPPQGNIAIMFTDIQSSTELWKRSVDEMNIALEQHNEIIRDCCRAEEGYEVKTIGDSFMVSFADPLSAARCALSIQSKFAQAVWPTGLDLPPSGMVIRIGLNHGSCISEENPVTARVDYRGSTVNMASRLEGKAMPGTTCVSADTFAAIQAEVVRAGTAMLHNYGTHTLKGLGQHTLYLLVPKTQEHRTLTSTSDCVDQEALRQKSSDNNSSSGSARSSSAIIKLARIPLIKTGLRVDRSSVTVAVCRLALGLQTDSLLFERASTMVRAGAEAAGFSCGVVDSVAGNSMTILWNASKTNKNHVLSGLTFVTQVQKRTEGVMRVGLATGSVLYGNVGTVKNRFATVFGVPVAAAAAVAELAHALQTYAIYADCMPTAGSARLPDMGGLRVIDLWKEAESQLLIEVSMMDIQLLHDELGMWDEPDTEQIQRAQKQNKLIHSYCNDPSSSTLTELSQLAETFDDALLVVCH
eukprot:Rhum_TRINITY_DN8503_c0_g1::Rhum_TRINITY_DN8503_c0_g1_i1::g.28383::m.28383